MTSKDIFNTIVCPVSGKFGAPMGRRDNKNVSEEPATGAGQLYFKCIQICWDTMPHFDRVVPLDSGGYDKGGAYWGLGSPLRLRYTKDGQYWEFYRTDNL